MAPQGCRRRLDRCKSSDTKHYTKQRCQRRSCKGNIVEAVHLDDSGRKVRHRECLQCGRPAFLGGYIVGEFVQTLTMLEALDTERLPGTCMANGQDAPEHRNFFRVVS